MTPRLSIVIPTHNRRRVLSKVLDGLTAQTAPAEWLEVIVVDDGSSDGTVRWLEKQHPAFSLRVLEQSNRGPSTARNAGVDAARGELVLFLDDDVVPTPNAVAEHIRAHSAGGDIAVVGPLLSLPKYRQPWVVWHQRTIEKTYAKWAREGDSSFRLFWTGAASVRKRAVVEAGGFDVRLKRYEDIDLGYRLMKRGVRFVFNQAAGGYHHAERSLASWREISAEYGRHEVRVLRRLGGNALRESLAADWQKRHRLNKRVARICAGHPVRTSIAVAALTALVQAARLKPSSLYAMATCSALANVLYWHAILEELGENTSFFDSL